MSSAAAEAHVTQVAPIVAALRVLLVDELNLEGRDPSSIEPRAALFGDGLGLDSLDALQLAMAVEEQIGVRIPEGAEGRVAFASIEALSDFVTAHGEASRIDAFIAAIAARSSELASGA